MGLFVNGVSNGTSDFNLRGRQLANLYKRLLRNSSWWREANGLVKGNGNNVAAEALPPAYKNNLFSLAMWLAVDCARKTRVVRTSAECLLTQGRIFKVIGDFKLAEQRMLAARKKDPLFSHADIELADVYLSQKNDENAKNQIANSYKKEAPEAELSAKRDYLSAVLAYRKKEYFSAHSSATYSQWHHDQLPSALVKPLRRLKTKIRRDERARLLSPFVLQYDSNPLWLKNVDDAPKEVTSLSTLRTLAGVVVESDSFRFANEVGSFHSYEGSLIAVNHWTGGYAFLNSYSLAGSYKYSQRLPKPILGFMGFWSAAPGLQLTFQSKQLSTVALRADFAFSQFQLAPFLKYTPGAKVDSSGGFDFGLRGVHLFEKGELEVSSSSLLTFEKTLNSVFVKGENYRLRQGFDYLYTISQRLGFDATLPLLTYVASSWPKEESYFQAALQGGGQYYVLPWLAAGLKTGYSLRFLGKETITRTEITLSLNGVY